MNTYYDRSAFHCHISPTAIHISWGAKCPGADCDGLQALIDEGGTVNLAFAAALADAIIDVLDESDRLSEAANRQLRDSCLLCRTSWRDCVCDMQEGG